MLQISRPVAESDADDVQLIAPYPAFQFRISVAFYRLYFLCAVISSTGRTSRSDVNIYD